MIKNIIVTLLIVAMNCLTVTAFNKEPSLCESELGQLKECTDYKNIIDSKVGTLSDEKLKRLQDIVGNYKKNYKEKYIQVLLSYINNRAEYLLDMNLYENKKTNIRFFYPRSITIKEEEVCNVDGKLGSDIGRLHFEFKGTRIYIDFPNTYPCAGGAPGMHHAKENIDLAGMRFIKASRWATNMGDSLNDSGTWEITYIIDKNNSRFGESFSTISILHDTTYGAGERNAGITKESIDIVEGIIKSMVRYSR